MSAAIQPLRGLENVDTVIDDPLRFKLKLGIGEDAYTSLRLKKKLLEVWDVASVAATGATAAASPAVASTFFASTASGGLLSFIGLGTAAATPIGWVIAAAVASGGAYMGVTRFMGRFTQGRVEVIPKFLNTPMDLLGASLFDLLGGLAVRVAAIDGEITDDERSVIQTHFISDWGYSEAYVMGALALIEQQADQIRVKDVAAYLAAFQAENPDCNPSAMQATLMELLTEVVQADGRLDEREELALDAVAGKFAEASNLSLSDIRKSVANLPARATSSVRKVAGMWPIGLGKAKT